MCIIAGYSKYFQEFILLKLFWVYQILKVNILFILYL